MLDVLASVEKNMNSLKVSILVSIFIVVENAASLSFLRCQNAKDKVECKMQKIRSIAIHNTFLFPRLQKMAVLLLFVLHDVTYFHGALPYIYIPHKYCSLLIYIHAWFSVLTHVREF